MACPVTQSSGGIGPYLWAADDRWYRGTPAHFLVIENPSFGGIDVGAATQAFGRETARYSVAGYTVLVWDKDITPLLSRP